jgi:hypothetical protein
MTKNNEAWKEIGSHPEQEVATGGRPSQSVQKVTRAMFESLLSEAPSTSVELYTDPKNPGRISLRSAQPELEVNDKES